MYGDIQILIDSELPTSQSAVTYIQTTANVVVTYIPSLLFVHEIQEEFKKKRVYFGLMMKSDISTGCLHRL